MPLTIHDLIEVAIKRNATDLVLKAGARPHVRVNGVLEPLTQRAISPDDAAAYVHSIVVSAGRDYLLQYPCSTHESRDPVADYVESAMRKLAERTELDLVFSVPRVIRVRANLFLQHGHLGAALRLIPLDPLTISDLHLPKVLTELATQPQGLIIVTGPTGSGKTTTLAAVIEEINRNRACNIYTIEQPIEYVFTDKQSLIHQREVGADTQSWAAALRSVTRQSPDVIAIGEMRDPETMEAAMTAAEIGHLVLATLHTTSAAATVDRIVNAFPLHLKHQVLAQLASSLLCVTSQRLVRLAGGEGRIPAVEVLSNSPGVRKHIEDNETGALYAAMRDGRHYGMNTMNQALDRLYQCRMIGYNEAMQYAGNAAELKQMLRNTA